MTPPADAPKLPPLSLDAPITRANLGHALAELIASLPDITDPSVKAGDLASNAGILELVKG